MDRRRGPPPPPPPPGGFRDPRGGDPFRDREMLGRGGPRRGRSQSPVYDRYRGGPRDSPPPYKRYRRDEPAYDRYGRDISPGPYRGGRSPPPYRSDRERDPFDGAEPSPDRRDGPDDKPAKMMTFKEFMLSLPDDPSPEEAQTRYKQYMVEYHGGEIKAEFVEKKNDEATRAMFDPRVFEKVLMKRNEEARESAKQFAADLESGRMDPQAEGFNQGMFELAPKQEKSKSAAAPGAAEDTDMAEAGGSGEGTAAAAAKESGGKAVAAAAKAGEEGGDKGGAVFAPAVCWRPARVAVDLALAKRLVLALDAEKGIEGNSLAQAAAVAAATDAADAAAPSAAAPEPMAVEAAAAGGSGEGAPVVAAAGGEDGKAEAKEPEEKAEGAPDAEEGKEARAKSEGAAEPAEAAEEAAPAAAAEAPATEVASGSTGATDEASLCASVGQLDVLLTYLWRVHGVDYYAGYELTASEFGQRLTTSRILRGAPPAQGEVIDEDEAKRQSELVERTVNDSFEKRLKEGDPLENKCQRKRVEEALDKWVEDQVVMHAEGKWGNKLSTKMFVAKKFVLKHVRSKHEDKLLAEKEKAYDEIYFENFKTFHEEEAKELEAQQQAEAMEGVDGGAAHGGGHGAPRGRGARGGMGPRGGGRFPGMGRGGRGPGMMGGGRGGMMGMMDMPMASMVPAGMPMMMPGMGPMIMIPAGGMMGGMMAPMMAMGGRAMGMGMGGRGGRFGGGGGGGIGPRGGGGGGGRGAGSGPRFGAPMMLMGGGREYYDLDNPHNNRAVLDYGDL